MSSFYIVQNEDGQYLQRVNDHTLRFTDEVYKAWRFDKSFKAVGAVGFIGRAHKHYGVEKEFFIVEAYMELSSPQPYEVVKQESRREFARHQHAKLTAQLQELSAEIDE